MAVLEAKTAATPEHGLTRVWVALAVLAVVVIWLVVGFLRAPKIAQDYVVTGEAPRTVSDLRITSTFPGIPPLFVVQVESTISEPGGASYMSGRILWIEPFTGIVLNDAAS